MKYKLKYLGEEDEFVGREFKLGLDTDRSNIDFYILEDMSGIRFHHSGDSFEGVQDLGKLLNQKSFLNKIKKEIEENKDE